MAEEGRGFTHMVDERERMGLYRTGGQVSLVMGKRIYSGGRLPGQQALGMIFGLPNKLCS